MSRIDYPTQSQNKGLLFGFTFIINNVMGFFVIAIKTISLK